MLCSFLYGTNFTWGYFVFRTDTSAVYYSSYGVSWVCKYVAFKQTSFTLSFHLSGPVAGGLVNKFGCRMVTIVGSVVSALGVIIASFSSDLDVLIITYGLIGGKFTYKKIRQETVLTIHCAYQARWIIFQLFFILQ